MHPLYLLGAAYTVAIAVYAVRRGDAGQWLWLIVIFGPIGATIYLVQALGSRPLDQLALYGKRFSGRDVETARREVQRLDTGHAWREYAAALRQSGKPQEALVAARTAAEREPDALETHQELGLALLAAGQPAPAVGELARVVDADPHWELGAALFSLARSQELSGDLAAARASLERLVERHSETQILWQLGCVQRDLGDHAAARATFQRLVDDAAYVPRYLRGKVAPWVRRARRELAKLPA